MVRVHRTLFKAIVDAVYVIVDTIMVEIITNIDVVVFIVNILFLIDRLAFNLYVLSFPSHSEVGISILLVNQVVHIETHNLSHSVGTKALYIIERVVIRSYFVV